MITRMRLLLVLARPAVIYLLAMYAALGAESGGGATNAALAKALVTVVGFLLCSVAINDLSDAAIDRVNLPGDRRRPLVVGIATRVDMVVVAVAGATCAIVGAALIGAVAIAVTVWGLLVSLGYSMQPVRLADRGAVASLVLPACYVAVPFLDGLLASGGQPRPAAMILLAGLYLGFIGRILLKDFRDVRGDALFGKRTFLVRHGRRVTCLVSGLTWLCGSAIVGWLLRSPALDVSYAASAVAVCVLLAALARTGNLRTEELMISALAIVGRGTLLVLLALRYTSRVNWSPTSQAALLAVLTSLTAVLAARMLLRGPRSGLSTDALRHIERAERRSTDILTG